MPSEEDARRVAAAFGLDAATGVADALRKQGRGYRVADVFVPIVPGAILFDLINGGDKSWDANPYGALGVRALAAAGAFGALAARYGAEQREGFDERPEPREHRTNL